MSTGLLAMVDLQRPKIPPTPTPTPGAGTIRVITDSQWANGMCAHLDITGQVPAKVTLKVSGTVTSLWNATSVRSGDTLTLTLPSWALNRTSHKDTGLCISGGTVSLA